eukprot:495929_1
MDMNSFDDAPVDSASNSHVACEGILSSAPHKTQVTIKQEPDTEDSKKSQQFAFCESLQFDQLDSRCMSSQISETPPVCGDESQVGDQIDQATDSTDSGPVPTSNALFSSDGNPKESTMFQSSNVEFLRSENETVCEEDIDSDATLSDEEMRADHLRNQGPRKSQPFSDDENQASKDFIDCSQTQTSVSSTVAGNASETHDPPLSRTKVCSSNSLINTTLSSAMCSVVDQRKLSKAKSAATSGKKRKVSKSHADTRKRKISVLSKARGRPTSTPKQFECDWCHSGFTLRNNLQTHKKKRCSRNPKSDISVKSVSLSVPLSKLPGVAVSVKPNKMKASNTAVTCEWCGVKLVSPMVLKDTRTNHVVISNQINRMLSLVNPIFQVFLNQQMTIHA